MKPVGLLWPSEVVPLGLSPWLFVAWVVPLVLALALVPPIVGSTEKQLVASGWGLYMNCGHPPMSQGLLWHGREHGESLAGCARPRMCMCCVVFVYVFICLFPHNTQTPEVLKSRVDGIDKNRWDR